MLREKGVADGAITVIPDEQEAMDAALRMGQPGDLLLLFADALTRSWKQVTKFKSDGSLAPAMIAQVTPAPADEAVETVADDDASLFATGFVRDERGLRFVAEAAD